MGLGCSIDKEAQRRQPSCKVTARGQQNEARKPSAQHLAPHAGEASGRSEDEYLAIVNDRQLDVGEQVLHDGVEEWHVD